MKMTQTSMRFKTFLTYFVPTRSSLSVSWWTLASITMKNSSYRHTATANKCVANLAPRHTAKMRTATGQQSFSQWTSHMEPSATSTTVTRPVRECLQAGTKDAPVFNRPAPLRRLHDSAAGRKYPDSITAGCCNPANLTAWSQSLKVSWLVLYCLPIMLLTNRLRTTVKICQQKTWTTNC